MAAQVKLTEMWKPKKIEDYPVKVKFQETMPGDRETRGTKNGKMVETGRSTKSKAIFVGYAPRIWNKTPVQITTAKTLV